MPRPRCDRRWLYSSIQPLMTTRTSMTLLGLFAIEQLIAHGVVEAVDVGILLRVALLDEGRLDPMFGEPIPEL